MAQLRLHAKDDKTSTFNDADELPFWAENLELMTEPNRPVELAARFIAALYAATRGRPGRFRRIDDCAFRAGIKRAADIKRAMRTAEKAGFLAVHVSGPMVTLTGKGLKAAIQRS
jgi:hypothetical protein